MVGDPCVDGVVVAETKTGVEEVEGMGADRGSGLQTLLA